MSLPEPMATAYISAGLPMSMYHGNSSMATVIWCSVSHDWMEVDYRAIPLLHVFIPSHVSSSWNGLPRTTRWLVLPCRPSSDKKPLLIKPNIFLVLLVVLWKCLKNSRMFLVLPCLLQIFDLIWPRRWDWLIPTVMYSQGLHTITSSVPWCPIRFYPFILLSYVRSETISSKVLGFLQNSPTASRRLRQFVSIGRATTIPHMMWNGVRLIAMENGQS